MLSIQKVYEPSSLLDALYILQDPNIKPIAAGTDIIPAVRDGVLTDISLLDLKPLRDSISYIRLENYVLRIGAMTTHTAIAESAIVLKNAPALAAACGQIGSAQLRNRATLGGNIVHASPAADSAPFLVAAGASVVFTTLNGESSMPLSDFLVGPRKTQLPQGALLTEIQIPIPFGGLNGGYYKVGGRTSLTIAIVSVAVLKADGAFRVAYGSMSAKVSRCKPVEDFLNSAENVSQDEMLEVVGSALHPISDVRASAQYRLVAAANLTWLGYHELSQNCQ